MLVAKSTIFSNLIILNAVNPGYGIQKASVYRPHIYPKPHWVGLNKSLFKKDI